MSSFLSVGRREEWRTSDVQSLGAERWDYAELRQA
jgi:hypothetical protein